MRVINLTPHRLDIVHAGGVYSIPPSGEVARVVWPPVETLQPIEVGAGRCPECGEEHGGERPETGCSTIHPLRVDLPVRRQSGAGVVVGVPAPTAGTVFVVSGMVLDHPGMRDRVADVYAPGELVRGADGQPTGCRGLTMRGVGR